MNDRKDPTRPLSERTQEELFEFVDDHLILALQAADLVCGDRQVAEDYVRNRLVAISDSYDKATLAGESSRRRMARLRQALSQ